MLSFKKKKKHVIKASSVVLRSCFQSGSNSYWSYQIRKNLL